MKLKNKQIYALARAREMLDGDKNGSRFRFSAVTLYTLAKNMRIVLLAILSLSVSAWCGQKGDDTPDKPPVPVAPAPAAEVIDIPKPFDLKIMGNIAVATVGVDITEIRRNAAQGKKNGLSPQEVKREYTKAILSAVQGVLTKAYAAAQVTDEQIEKEMLARVSALTKEYETVKKSRPPDVDPEK